MEINKGNATSTSGSVPALPIACARTFRYTKPTFNNDGITLSVFLNGQWIILQRVFANC
ncbi:hypothetical protein [Bacillus wiedmannii]|uniref:hypothetical protein n=1 Tax=Bacillus wiedmannii TaxID=1890302 RepID=UPI0018DCFB95|nr:hypothetical protein [Bacillus wiedmannii]